MKYFIKTSKNSIYQEVSRSEYLMYIKQAGYYMGENYLIKSFYDPFLKIEGFING